MYNKSEMIEKMKKDWTENPRWKGIERPYTAEEVVKLKGSNDIKYTLAEQGAKKFWDMLMGDEVVCALGALTGNQAVQEVQAGMKAIYCSGWQVAADNNSIGTMYPDQSLYPVDSVPKLVEKISLKFPGKIAIGLDAKKGFVTTEGWSKTKKITVTELAKKYEDPFNK